MKRPFYTITLFLKDTIESGLINDHVNSTLSFKPNKTYRLRFVNMAGIATFNVYIDGHDMQVIEVDGVKCDFS